MARMVTGTAHRCHRRLWNEFNAFMADYDAAAEALLSGH